MARIEIENDVKIYVSESEEDDVFEIIDQTDRHYLIRWTHSGFEMWFPIWFIDYMENSGQIIRHT